MISIIMLLVVVAIFGVVVAMFLSLGRHKAGYVSQQPQCQSCPPAENIQAKEIVQPQPSVPIHPPHRQNFYGGEEASMERPEPISYQYASYPYIERGPLRAPGPYPGVPQGIPVPAGALKATADYGHMNRLNSNFPYQQRPLESEDFFRGFVGSVDAYAPFPSVATPWEKAGILTSTVNVGGAKNEILNLYRRPIAPMQELWEYQVQDKNGFMIKLDRTRYLEDGDVIQEVIGKQGRGPWKVHMFVQNRYVWV